jgi:hypothetical protein
MLLVEDLKSQEPRAKSPSGCGDCPLYWGPQAYFAGTSRRVPDPVDANVDPSTSILNNITKLSWLWKWGRDILVRLAILPTAQPQGLEDGGLEIGPPSYIPGAQFPTSSWPLCDLTTSSGTTATCTLLGASSPRAFYPNARTVLHLGPP